MIYAISYLCPSYSYTLLNFNFFAAFLGVTFSVLLSFIFYRSLIPSCIISESPVNGIDYPLGSTMSSPSRFNSPKINLLENSLRRKPLYLKNDSIHSSPVASSPSSPCIKGNKLDSSFTFSNDITSLSNCGGSFESPDNSRLSVGEFPLISLTSGLKKSLTPKAPKLEPKSISLKIEVPEPTSNETTETSASPDPLLNILRTFNRKRKTLTPVEADSGTSLSNGTTVGNDFETSIEDSHSKKMTRHNLCASLLESQLSIPATLVEKIPENVTSKRTREEAGVTSGTKRHCSKLSSEIISSLSSMKKFHHKKSTKRKFKENSGGVIGNVEKMPRTSLRLPKNKIRFIDTEFDSDIKKCKKYAEQGTQVDNEVIDSSPKQTKTVDASCSTPEATSPSLPVIKIKRDTVSERVVTRAIVNSHLQYQSAIAKFMMGGHPAFLGMKPNGTEPRELEMQPLPFGPASQSDNKKVEGGVGGVLGGSAGLGGSGAGFSLQAGGPPSLSNPLVGSPATPTSSPSKPVTTGPPTSTPLLPTTTSTSVPTFQFTPTSSSAPITSTAGSTSSLSTLQFKAPDPKPPPTTTSISGAKPGGFSFGFGSTTTADTCTTTSTPGASISSTTTTVTSTSNPALPTSTPQFGLSTATTSTFTFKSPAVSSAEQKPISTAAGPSVTFGVSSTFKIPGASSAAPTFGLGSTSSSNATPTFSFSSKPNENATTTAAALSTTSTAPSIFSFGAPPAVTQTSVPASTTVATPSTTSTTPSLFGGAPLSFSSGTTLNFASASTTATTASAAPTFGASQPTTTSAPSFSSATSSPFAANPTPGPATAAPTFGPPNPLFSLKPTTTAGFAAPTTTSIFSTPANSSTPATTASLFNPNPSNLFGNSTATTTAAAPTASTPFGTGTFGAPTTSSSVFGSTFGGSTFTNPGASPFPVTSTSAPKFGSTTGGFGTTTTASSVFSFGGTPATTTAPTPAFQFGHNSTTTASPFRSSTTPSFGQTATPTFGGQTTSAFSAPAASGPLFGASSGGSSFGTHTTTTPAFGNAVPTFGSATTTMAPTPTTTSMFGAAPPNNKPFEFSSAQKTGGFKFSLNQSQANPTPFQAAPTPFQSATTTSAFVFGQNNTTPQQAKPFQFPSGTPGFGAGPSAAPAFATPGPSTAFQFNATPQQQAPGTGQPMFSIGTGSPTPARSKRDSRPRRR